MDFYGRKQEITDLQTVINSEDPRVAVVYGRRRIGKTSLIREALRNVPFLIIEGLENRPKRDQVSHFIYQVCYQLELPQPKKEFPGWEQAFIFLYESLLDRPHHIVLDEFQWMGNYRQEIVSDLKAIWEQYISTIKGVSLILSGSVASFMVRKVIRSSALYGRVDVEINLKGFQLHETAHMLSSRGVSEIMEAQIFSGGVPKYIELLERESSVRLGLGQIAFSPNGYFVTEYPRIFVSHFGKNENYEKIVRSLSRKPYGMFRNELCEEAKLSPGGYLSDLLYDLEMAGFISSVTPLDKALNSRLVKYQLSDAYLRFYFAFIEPMLKEIKSFPVMLAERTLQSSKFQSWLGISFEYTCVQHSRKIADILGFGGIEYSAGAWFRKPGKGVAGAQVDLLFDRRDQVVTLCEMKYLRKPVGVSIIDEVERKVQVIESAFPSKTIQRVLLTNSSVSRELQATGYFYRVISPEELINL